MSRVDVETGEISFDDVADREANLRQIAAMRKVLDAKREPFREDDETEPRVPYHERHAPKAHEKNPEDRDKRPAPRELVKVVVAQMRMNGIVDRQQALDHCEKVIGHPISSRSDLTTGEGARSYTTSSETHWRRRDDDPPQLVEIHDRGKAL